MNYTDGTYKYLGDGKFERYDREALGYWVSSTSNAVTSGDEYVKQVMLQLVNQESAKYVGIWTDDEGTRYVDKSHYTTDRELAESAGRHWKQEAIWDIANNQAIYL